MENRYFKVLFVVLISLACCVVSRASDEEILNNDTIRTLVKAGLSPSIIVSKIKASKCNFDISTNELLRFKQEKIPDEVVNTMVQAMQPEPAPAVPQAVVDPNDPVSPHPPGIYWMKESESKPELVQLQPSMYTQAKTSGMFKSALTWGIAKGKVKAVLPGAHATLQITEVRPVLYFYFETKTAGTEQYATAAPNEFILCKMTSKVKDKTREIEIAETSFAGAKSGANEKYIIHFDYEQLAAGIFKVTPKRDLEFGEYGFHYTGASPLPAYGTMGGMSSGKVFDFGIAAQVAKD